MHYFNVEYYPKQLEIKDTYLYNLYLDSNPV